MDLPIKTPFLKTLRGYVGGAAWRSLETLMQVGRVGGLESGRCGRMPLMATEAGGAGLRQCCTTAANLVARRALPSVTPQVSSRTRYLVTLDW